jgi:hypothetical protein
MKEKKCTKCKEVKRAVEFYKNKSKHDGFSTECKECSNKISKERYFLNHDAEKQKRRNDYIKNKEAYIARARKRWAEKKDEINEYRRTDPDYRERTRKLNRIWREKNIDKAREQAKRSQRKNRARRNKYLRDRKVTDIRFKLDCNMASAISGTIKGKTGHGWQKLLGYTSQDLAEHLEARFTPEMTWDNYGSYWHIDHIIPKVHFTYTKKTDKTFLECWSLKNLQPLEATENIRKGTKLMV